MPMATTMASPPPQSLLRLPLLLFLLTTLALSSASATANSVYPKEALPTKSGYLRVNSTTRSSIFYTFYEAQNPTSPSSLPQTPILIWLQGGPGCSSMLANFFELGPWLLNQDAVLHPNPASWNKMFGLLFLDNPIGTGFSIAASPQEIPRNQFDVARHLFTALREFVALDSSFRTRPIYITGESYAGKYLPALGYYILKQNPLLPRASRINLAGVAIGNGLTDPEIQVATHAVNCYNLGLINEKQMAQLEKLQSETIGLIRRERWGEAGDARNRVLNTLTNMTGLATLYDFRRLTPYPNRVVVRFLNNAEVKRALGVEESAVFQLCSPEVGDALHDDVMKSVRFMVEFLVRETRVLLYQGQADLRDGVMSTLSWVRMMRWEGIRGFLEAERKVWREGEGGGLAGYVQRWEKLSHVVVMNAGHLVPTDQPANSQAMIQDWVLEKGLFAGGKE
ncbi:serine carboxypeptidase-like 50 [Andrographis paniculata]|uniref:serine carboxypeptidase-like 50 n=1 Tax=Andrographis paniculata TaxID=175694 RepID=UPI0021E8D959|nr:serine carboxypeptidase-like 50 [Andrographis paniculata]